MLTPPEILRQRFRRALLGYSRHEVHEFLRMVSETVQHLLEENRTLQEERERLLERLHFYEGMERQLRDALIIAERAAEEFKEAARQEAELILAQARQEAERIKDEAKKQVWERFSEVERLQQTRQRMMVELRHLLQTYLEMLERFESVPF